MISSMNQNRSPLLSLWLALALAILPALRAQEAPPATPAPAEKPAVEESAPPAADEKASVAEADETKATAEESAVKPAAEEPMRELAPGKDADSDSKAKPSKRSRRSRSFGYDGNTDRPPFGNHSVPKGQKWREAVSVFGSTTIEGEVTDAAVSVIGNTTIKSGAIVGDAAVSVLGTTRIDGHVKGEAVAVLGDVILGPEAKIDGEVVAVLGKVIRDKDSVISGGVNEVGSFGEFGDFGWLRAWVTKCLLWGRPLAFGENLRWTWLVAAGFLVFYMLLALLFPRGIERCAEVLEQKPGNTILAALLAALLTPIVLVLLAITGIGIILIPFLIAGLFFGTLFGKAAVFAWFGRRVTHLFGEGLMRHAVIAVFFGGLMVMFLYVIPFLGFLLWKLFGILGLGMVVYVLISSMKREKPAAAPAPVMPATAPAAAMAVPMAAQSAGFGAAAPAVEPPPAFAAPQPILSADTLPRAGFWIRFAASLLDFIMIAVTCGILDLMHRGPGPLFIGLAAYSAVMWKLKGTTIGGIICGLKLVRLDDRPIDWGVAIVRSLSGFLSLFAAGLGFIWVAFDNDRQSWHDKIAGTTIVKVPKGTPLV
jgi:uncharacterized RDD family membrane protein YckC